MTVLMSSLRISAAPRWATRRDPSRKTFGPAVAAVAQALGWELLPWQRLVADVACEVNADGTWRYPTVIVSTPRQAGKSTLTGAILAHRAMVQQDALLWYTAQSGKDATQTWGKWNYKFNERMPGRWATRLSAGTEHLTFRGTNGAIRPFSPQPKSLHGQQADAVFLDECWAFTPTDGADLLQAVIPTQATRRMRQLFLLSTAGDEDSTWFRGWIEKGRESVNDPSSPIAFFEWSAPDDAPMDDPATWADFHPGYPQLINDDAMQTALAQFGAEGFARGYLNRWPTAEASWRASWPLLADPDAPIPAVAQVCLAVDSGLNHRAACISAAATLPDGRIAVELIDYRSGVDWLLPRLTELTRRHRCSIVLQRTGPLGYLCDELARAGVQVTAVSGAEYGDAVSRFRTLVSSQQLAHLDDPRLNQAVDAVESSQRGDRPIWKRAKGQGVEIDISPLVAVTLAAWQAATPPVAPRIVTI